MERAPVGGAAGFAFFLKRNAATLLKCIWLVYPTVYRVLVIILKP